MLSRPSSASCSSPCQPPARASASRGFRLSSSYVDLASQGIHRPPVSTKMLARPMRINSQLADPFSVNVVATTGEAALATWRRHRKADVHRYGASPEQHAPHPHIQGAVARPHRSAEAWHDSESEKSTRTLRSRKRRARRRRVVVGAAVAIIAAAAAVVFAAEGNKTIAAPYPEPEVSFRSSSPGSAGLALAHPPRGLDVPRTPPQVGSKEGRRAGVYSSITTGRIDARVRDVPTRIYVPNNHSNTVDVIDPRTHRVVRSFSVGDSPQHVTPGWNMRFLYVGDISRTRSR